LALFEIRDSGGTLRARGASVDECVAQLVASCERYEATVRSMHAIEDARVRSEPDTSATAPEHLVGFVGGWKACQRQWMAADF